MRWGQDMLHAQDIRYAFRLLARSPGFALLTILVLAGGLGLSTFTFSFLYTGMMRPLPLGEGDRIVRFMQAVGDRRMPLDVADVSMLRSSMKSVRDVGGYTQREVIVGREGERRVLDATVTDPVLFSVARTHAFLGRALLPSDAEPGAEPVIVLAHRTWQVAFGEDRSIVNTIVAIDGVATRVVGVMPEGFGFPVTQDAWMPRPASVTPAIRPGSELVSVFARLTPTATQAQASAEATSLLRAGMIARDSTTSAVARYAVAVESYPAAQIGEERTLVFTFLNLLAGLILVLALVNVTTLLTARAAVDPLLVPGTVFRASEVIEKSGLVARGMTKLFGGCFIFALLLAVAGTYGLMSRSIGLRTREIGVRRALGATDSVAARMLLGQGARQLAVGTLIAAPILIVIGVAATAYLPLGGVTAAASGVVVSVAIVAVVLTATWLPTREALRVPLRDALWRE